MSYRFKLKFTTLAAMFIALPFAMQAQTPSQGAQIFEKSCYSCHNIGGGDKKGPDLKGVTTRRTRDWLHEFIKTPSAMNRSDNSDAQAVFRKYAPEVMPDQAITADQIDALIALIEDYSKRNKTFFPAGAKLARQIIPADVDEGYLIFTGQSKPASPVITSKA